MYDVMLDLETLGTRPGSVVLSIGAVFFDEHSLGSEFYRVISQESCVDAGLTIDEKTVQWWSEQSDAAKEIVFAACRTDATPLKQALEEFSAFLNVTKDAELVRVWGNGANFDQPVLTAAYDAAGVPVPWKFWNDRCYRTLKNIAPHVPFERIGVYHNALDDAKSQAVHAAAMLRRVRAESEAIAALRTVLTTQ